MQFVGFTSFIMNVLSFYLCCFYLALWWGILFGVTLCSNCFSVFFLMRMWVLILQLYNAVNALGVLVKSVHLVAGRLGFYSQSGHTKDFKNSIRSFRARRSAQAEVRRVLCMCCSSCYVP